MNLQRLWRGGEGARVKITVRDHAAPLVVNYVIAQLMFSHMRYIRKIPSTSEIAGLFMPELFFSSTDNLTRLKNWVSPGIKSESVPRRLLLFYPKQILIQRGSLSASHVIRVFT